MRAFARVRNGEDDRPHFDAVVAGFLRIPAPMRAPTLALTTGGFALILLATPEALAEPQPVGPSVAAPAGASDEVSSSDEEDDLPPAPPPPLGAQHVPPVGTAGGTAPPTVAPHAPGPPPPGYYAHPFSPPPPFQYPPIEDEDEDPPSAAKAYTKLGFGVPLTIIGTGACLGSFAYGMGYELQGLSVVVWGPLLIGGLGALGAGIPLWASGGRELARAEDKGPSAREPPATSELRVGAGSLAWTGAF
jgi:hypothetical protein